MGIKALVSIHRGSLRAKRSNLGEGVEIALSPLTPGNDARVGEQSQVLDVIGFGALNIDHLYLVPRVLKDGEALVKKMVLSPGGSAANTIYGLAKLGIKTGFVGMVGDDEAGKLLLESFEQVGVDVSGVKIAEGAKTGEVLALVRSGGKRSLYVLPGANNLLRKKDIDLDYLFSPCWLHLSSFVFRRQFELQIELISTAPSGLKISLSPGLFYTSKGLKALKPILSRTEILFLNQQELTVLCKESELSLGAKKCLEVGVKLVVVTLGGGKKGVCYLRDDKQEIHIPATYPVKVVDTTGAGDAFCAGFLYGKIQGRGLKECARLGEIMAAFCVGKLGARSALPARKKLEQEYQKYFLDS